MGRTPITLTDRQIDSDRDRIAGGGRNHYCCRIGTATEADHIHGEGDGFGRAGRNSATGGVECGPGLGGCACRPATVAAIVG